MKVAFHVPGVSLVRVHVSVCVCLQLVKCAERYQEREFELFIIKSGAWEGEGQKKNGEKEERRAFIPFLKDAISAPGGTRQLL